MKQFILFITILIFAGQAATAQKIRFTDSGNVWHELFAGRGTGGIRMYEILQEGMINGMLYKATNFPKHVNSTVPFVREDTITKQVFILTDTTEYLLYDFSLNVGDTMYYPQGKHFVERIDSVLIDSISYKVSYFSPENFGWEYAVIENIGCIDGLLFPFFNYNLVNGYYQMACFHNAGNKPVFSSPIAYGNQADNFNNTDSCYVSIADISNNNQNLTIAPHPANWSSVITLPYRINNGTIVVYNGIGQVVSTVSIHNVAKIDVKALNLLSGLYYYRITDNNNAATWQGKLLYE